MLHYPCQYITYSLVILLKNIVLLQISYDVKKNKKIKIEYGITLVYNLLTDIT